MNVDSPILQGLNPDQREAVLHEEGPLLVLAGPGSGKTRVITLRLAYLVSRGVSPWNILCVTFTNKAAEEMKRRVLDHVAAQGLWVSTFHASCARLLRQHAEAVGRTSEYHIYDAEDQLACIKDCMKKLDMASAKEEAQTIRSIISKAKAEFVSPRDFAEKNNWGVYRHAAEVYRTYEDLLKARDAMDFDDLLVKTVALFSERPDILRQYHEKFRHILVDEYQDTNHVQHLLVQLLAKGTSNICAAGDPNQSIYAFRGALIENILSFERDYPGAKVVTLGQNYRSTQTVLDLASRLVSRNESKKEMKLWTENGKGIPPKFLVGEDEARLVASEIKDLIRSGRSYKDIAIFFRMNAQSRLIEQAFIEAGIPYVIVGGLRFYERKEIKDALAYLRLIQNPSDDLCAKRIINVPPRGIGQTTVQFIERFALERGLCFLDAARRALSDTALSGRAVKAMTEFLVLVDGLQEKAKGLPLPDIMDLVLKESGYLEGLQKDQTEVGENRRENVDELRRSLLEFQEEVPEASLASYLQSVSLLTDVDRWDPEKEAVPLMTFHSAKGLEFPVVFLVGMEEGVLPHVRALDYPPDVEEERRLCYVGITRAREELRFCFSTGTKFGAYGAFQPEPSRFLSEMGLSGELEEEEEEEDPRRAKRKGDEFLPGDWVQHPMWGEGKIRRITGSGKNAVATIEFDVEFGTKRVSLAVAPLERI